MSNLGAVVSSQVLVTAYRISAFGRRGPEPEMPGSATRGAVRAFLNPQPIVSPILDSQMRRHIPKSIRESENAISNNFSNSIRHAIYIHEANTASKAIYNICEEQASKNILVFQIIIEKRPSTTRTPGRSEEVMTSLMSCNAIKYETICLSRDTLRVVWVPLLADPAISASGRAGKSLTTALAVGLNGAGSIASSSSLSASAAS